LGARLGRRDCPQTRRVRSPLGAVTMVPPGGWSLVDNKRNTHRLLVQKVILAFVRLRLKIKSESLPPTYRLCQPLL